jgi:hypothetical protein
VLANNDGTIPSPPKFTIEPTPKAATISRALKKLELNNDNILDNPHYMLLPREIRYAMGLNWSQTFDSLFLKILKYYDLQIKKSSVHGMGLFTTVDIRKDKFIFPFFGTYYRKSTIDNPEHPLHDDANIVAISDEIKIKNEEIVLLLHYLCPGRYQNHQPKSLANVEIGINPLYYEPIQINSFRYHHGGLLPPNLIMVQAIKDIKAGEELTFTYDYSDNECFPFPEQFQQDNKEDHMITSTNNDHPITPDDTTSISVLLYP